MIGLLGPRGLGAAADLKDALECAELVRDQAPTPNPAKTNLFQEVIYNLF